MPGLFPVHKPPGKAVSRARVPPGRTDRTDRMTHVGGWVMWPPGTRGAVRVAPAVRPIAVRMEVARSRAAHVRSSVGTGPSRTDAHDPARKGARSRWRT